MNSYGNPPRNDGWNNDSGNGNFDGQRRSDDFQNQGGQGFQGQGFQSDQGFQDQGFGNNQGQGQGQQWSAGPGENYGNTGYQGDTTDVNTFGAGPQGGQNQDWQGQQGYDQNRQGQQGYDQNQDQGQNFDNQGGAAGGPGGKPSMGQRVKGEVEEIVGKVTRNPGKVERGQEEKSGW